MSVKTFSYLNIVIDGSAPYLDRFFTYAVPAHLAEELKTGQFVKVPWGKKSRNGFAVGFVERL